MCIQQDKYLASTSELPSTRNHLLSAVTQRHSLWEYVLTYVTHPGLPSPTGTHRNSSQFLLQLASTGVSVLFSTRVLLGLRLTLFSEPARYLMWKMLAMRLMKGVPTAIRLT